MPHGLRSRGKAASTRDEADDGAAAGAAASAGTGEDGAGVAFEAALGALASGEGIVDGIAVLDGAGDGCSVGDN